MKARNREVNIFNMSLLDILCGALGAFCFMMLGLFPYYSPGGPSGAGSAQAAANKSAAEIERMQEQIERLAESATSDEMKQMLEQQNQLLQDLQTQVQQQAGQITNLQSQLQDVQRQLKNRTPILVRVSWWTASHEAGVFVQFLGSDKEQKFDPTLHQGSVWPGDISIYSTSGPGTATFVMRDSPPGDYRIYYALVDKHGNAAACEMNGVAVSSAEPGTLLSLPEAKIEREKTGVLAGTLTVAEDGKIKFRSAIPTAARAPAPSGGR